MNVFRQGRYARVGVAFCGGHKHVGLERPKSGYNERMVRLYGVALPDEDARQLVALLVADSGTDAADAAAAIAEALTTGRSLIRLSPPMREALCRVLVVLPESLVLLREKLQHTTLLGREW